MAYVVASSWNSDSVEIRVFPTTSSFTSISAGSGTCAVASTAEAFCWGDDGVAGWYSIPTRVPGGFRYQAVSAGMHHSCGISESGATLCWGQGMPGYASLDYWFYADPLTVPVTIEGAVDLVAVDATGDFHGCGLASDGAVYCWGGDWAGQLGDGTPGDHRQDRLAVRVAGGYQFDALSVGGHHTCAIAASGETYCWGWNGYGQLGIDSASAMCGPALDQGPCQPTPMQVANDSGFASLAAGMYHTCAITASGDTYCWGLSDLGQLGIDSATAMCDRVQGQVPCQPTPMQVADDPGLVTLTAGCSHTCGLTAAGDAYCWGWNGYGQLATGDTLQSATPRAAASGLQFVALTAGCCHTCGLAVAGDAYCWGRNDDGQLGDGSNGSVISSSQPVRVSGQP